MNAETALSLHNLSVNIAGKNVCADLNLELGAGTCIGILGANGVGKTTLLNTIAGLRSASAGKVKLFARNLEDWKRRDLAKRLGMLMQQHEDPFPASVLDTALIGRHPHIDTWRWESALDEQIARDALAEADLEELVDREVHALSGGERRRLGIAMVLAQDPDIFLLDEPVDQLDPYYQMKLLEHFRARAVQQNKLVVMSLHDINLAARFCDNVMLLFGNGEILFGETYKVLHPDILFKLYGIRMRMITTEEAIAFLPE